MEEAFDRPSAGVARKAVRRFSSHTGGMELRDRFLGPIGSDRAQDADGPMTIDFGNLVRKLVLFDQIIVESHNLKEPAPITQKFGYDGAKALFESGRLRLVKDMVWVADIGRAPRPNRPVLPPGSYSINAARLTPPREYLSKQLHRIDAIPGLTSKQAKRLRQLTGSRLLTNPEEAVRFAQEQITRDFEVSGPVLTASVVRAVKREFEIDLDPTKLNLRLERLSERDWHAETDLDRVTTLTTRQIHDAVGQGLSAASALNIRLALMREFTALTGFQANDLPLFEQKLEFLMRELDPRLQDQRFDRVREVVGMPDVSNDPTVRDVDMAKLIEITAGPEVREFRQWLRTSDSLTDKELADLVHPVRDVLGKAIHGSAAKVVRFALSTGVGVILPPVGAGLGAIDTFLVDKLMPTPGPTAFLSHLSRSVFQG